MNDFFKPEDPFYDFLEKFMSDLPKMNDNHREPYIQMIEKLYPPFADIGQAVKHNQVPIHQFTTEQLRMLGCIHFRFKYDTSIIDVSTRFTFKEKAEELMKAYSK